MTKVDLKIGERVFFNKNINVSVWEKRGETELRWMLADIQLLMQDKGNDYFETVVISGPRSMRTVRCLQDQTPSAVS